MDETSPPGGVLTKSNVMKTKLTPAQQALYAELQSGRKIRRKNAHHMSGGTYVFDDTDELVRYKTFWGMVTALAGFGPPSWEFSKQFFVQQNEGK